ncbi:MAG: alginate export family protein [Planctomycetota bacterium]
MVEKAVAYSRRGAVFAGAFLLLSGPGLRAQTSQPIESRPATSQPALTPEKPASPAEKEAAPPKKAAPLTSKAWGTRLESEPPGYVKTLDKFGVPGLEKMDWLEFGLQHQTRFELRDDDYRRPTLQADEQFLLRSQTYLGIRKILDPFRFGIEFQDSRQFMSEYPETNRDVDEADFLQAFGELYFEDALGKGYPVQIRAGRMTLDLVDRRLVARNTWGNAPSGFDGFRLRLGQPSADWQFDFLAVQPVEKRLTVRNRTDEERWFYGLVGAWRRWAQIITLEPYYFILDEDRKDYTVADREIHTMGLHGFGPIGKTGFDYDFDTAFQFGEDGERKQRAFASYGEVGYTFQHVWKPRLSFSTAYASGDRNPDDSLSERFDKLFQTSHPYSTWDYFSWQNVISPKLRLEIQPWKQLRMDTSYGGYWLAADSDAWVVPGLRDKTGTSGDCVGQEWDVRVRYQIDPRLEVELGYAHFFPGPFVENMGPADDSDFFYVTTTLRF